MTGRRQSASSAHKAPAGQSSAQGGQSQPGQNVISNVPGQAGSSSSSAVKVAIPRLKKNDPAGGASAGGRQTVEKHRVSHACEPCRQRKTKCSGEKPICRHCEDFKINCVYGDGKRDRAKNELRNLQDRVGMLESLLNQVSPQLDDAGQHAITKALQRSPSAQTGSTESPSVQATADMGVEGEKLASAEVGSTGSLDKISEDVNDSAIEQPTGFMGKNTDVSWLKRIEKQMGEHEDDGEVSPGTPPQGTGYGFFAEQKRRQESSSVPTGYASSERHSFSHEQTADLIDDPSFFDVLLTRNIPQMRSTSTYQLDDLNLTMHLEDSEVFSVPQKHVADTLLDAYFSTIHTSFPFIVRPDFMAQYNKFMTDFNLPSGSKTWLAILNLMMGLGAVYSHLSHATWRGDVKDHLLFLSRARALFLDSGVLFNVPNLEQIQALGLAGLYLAATNQPNRAWSAAGLAIRCSYSIGLHLFNEDPKLSNLAKETRIRVWHSVFTLERLVTVLTGRPSGIHERYYSTPLPSVSDEDALYGAGNRQGDVSMGEGSAASDGRRHSVSNAPPTSPAAYYFIERIKLSRIALDILNRLYCADTVNLRWNEVQELIKKLDTKLTSWRSDLPRHLAFGSNYTEDNPNIRFKMNLAFEYHNTRMLVNRPCLCKSDERIPKESERSRSFNKNAAVTCVQNARDTVGMLPDNPDPAWVITRGPWWCILYYIVSAGIVIMIEIVFRAEHMSEHAQELVNDAQKVLRWLQAMGQDNLAANRSWESLNRLMMEALPKLSGGGSGGGGGGGGVASVQWGGDRPYYNMANAESSVERPAKRRSSAFTDSVTDNMQHGSVSGPNEANATPHVSMGEFPLYSKTAFDDLRMPNLYENDIFMQDNFTSSNFPSSHQIKRLREWQTNFENTRFVDPTITGDISGLPTSWWNFMGDGTPGLEQRQINERQGSFHAEQSQQPPQEQQQTGQQQQQPPRPFLPSNDG